MRVSHGRDVGIGQHPTSLLGKFLAVRQPNRLASACEPVGQQRSDDNGFAAGGWATAHHPRFNVGVQSGLNLL
ncbi:MAG: hypothetical protein F4Y91_04460 [Gemmatimonadetes bacterium]|nr:hypothetical protein [Gemmatimonadota bacterium]MXY81322.1 hypothetical protein [Gemmatimonadota bacterium]MYB71695.1 hypothetical protein [Gemmatimonadota bacterium]